jgi:hypothetical protein
LSASARDDIPSEPMGVADIVMDRSLAANTGGESAETTSPTIKSIRTMMDVFFTFNFWHIARAKSKGLPGRRNHNPARP